MNRTIAYLSLVTIIVGIPIACSSTGGSSGTNTSGSGASNGAGRNGSGGSGEGGLLFPSSSSASGSTGSGNPSTGSGSVFDAGLDDFCTGKGAIPIPGTTDCTGDIGKKVFLYAMCS